MNEPVIPEIGTSVNYNITSYDQWRVRAESAEAKVAEQAATIAELEESRKPMCPNCNSVGLSHCSDPINCGGVYWPDHIYRQQADTAERLDGLLERISQVSDQPFTETHEHLPDWIALILKNRIAYAKREWDEARQDSHLRAKTILLLLALDTTDNRAITEAMIAVTKALEETNG